MELLAVAYDGEPKPFRTYLTVLLYTLIRRLRLTI